MGTPTRFVPKVHAYLIPSITALHIACITSPPYTIVTFLPPVNEAQVISWWTACVKEIEEGTREIIMYLAPKPRNQAGALLERKSEGDTASKEQELEVVGIVMLYMPFSQTGSHKGFVEKFLVRSDWRGKAVGKKLMELLEVVALEKGRTVLILDTEKDSPAEAIYPRLGYIRVGVIPKYEISPFDGSLKDGVYFYKTLT